MSKYNGKKEFYPGKIKLIKCLKVFYPAVILARQVLKADRYSTAARLTSNSLIIHAQRLFY